MVPARFQLKKHFEKKPNLKYNALWSDVTKALEHQKNPGKRTVISTSIPIKMRSTAKKLNNFPMKGIPSARFSNGLSSDPKKLQQRSHVKRDGGAVLLDISDIPDPNKKRRISAKALNNNDHLNNNSSSQIKIEPSTIDATSSANQNMIIPDELKHFEPLFSGANKLTPASFNIILSFLSGNKENPLEEKFGQIVVLPLSQTIEKAHSPDGVEKSYHIETFFQMDYQSFEWKRLRKSKLINNEC